MALPELQAERLAAADIGLAVIEMVLPACVARAEAFSDVGDAELIDEERAVIANAVASGEVSSPLSILRSARCDRWTPPATRPRSSVGQQAAA